MLHHLLRIMSQLHYTAPNRPQAKAPTNIVVHQVSQLLEVEFSGIDGKIVHQLPFELLRVYSPSAEVMGHGPNQAVLQVGKQGVGIESIEPVGHYAIKPMFTDGHSSGLFTWDYLMWLGQNQEALWAQYLTNLEKAGASRNPESKDNARFLSLPKRSEGGCHG